MATLHNITGQFIDLYDIASECDSEFFADTLESLNFELTEKANGYAAVYLNLQADVKALEDEIYRLERIKSTIENNANRLKDHLKMAMDTIGIKSIDTDPRYKIKIVKNGGKAPLVINGEVPERFYKVVLEVDKAKIRQALETGEKLDFAYIGERGESLRIK